MNLNQLVKEIREFEGIKRKKAISKIVALLTEQKMNELESMSLGEDAAIIPENDETLLFAADGIWSKLLEKDPWWAGYCSVLVNINDIVVKGGVPIAMVNVLSMKDKEICHDVVRGMREAIKKFRVPMLGGHAHPDTTYNAVEVAIVGRAHKDHLMLSFGAKPGNDIMIGIDLDGRIHPNFELNWDTTTMKTSAEIRIQHDAVREIAQRKLATAAKDISNPGTVGTLAMLLETSKVGALLDVDQIPRPKSIKLSHWVKMYPGLGIILTTKKKDTSEAITILERAGLTTMKAGTIDNSQKLKISDGTNEKIAFDLKKEEITGVRL